MTLALPAITPISALAPSAPTLGDIAAAAVVLQTLYETPVDGSLAAGIIALGRTLAPVYADYQQKRLDLAKDYGAIQSPENLEMWVVPANKLGGYNEALAKMQKNPANIPADVPKLSATDIKGLKIKPIEYAALLPFITL